MLTFNCRLRVSSNLNICEKIAAKFRKFLKLLWMLGYSDYCSGTVNFS